MNDQMYMLRHDHIAQKPKQMPGAHRGQFIDDGLDHQVRSQQRQPSIAAKGDKAGGV